MKKVLIIHPEDHTTKFLNRVKNHIIGEFSEKVQHYNIKLNNSSHKKCLEVIRNHPNNNFVVFLGHGKSDSICGSKGRLSDVMGVNETLLDENCGDYYKKEIFIDKHAAGVFKEKNVFCLSCRSNESFATSVIDAGANSFIGFGNIPTSYGEFKEAGYSDVSNDLVRYFKTEINYIVKRSLYKAIEGNITVEELLHYIKFISNQRIVDILIRKDIKDRYVIADNIFNFKNEMKGFGNQKSKIYMD